MANRILLRAIAGLICLTSSLDLTCGQLQPIQTPATSPTKPSLTLFPRHELSVSTQPLADVEPVQFTAAIRCEQPGQPVRLVVTAQLAPECHLYSLTQPDGSATKLEVSVNNLYRIAGPFRPHQAPKISGSGTELDPRQEYHEGHIEFWLPIEIAPGADWKQLSIDVRINGQVCEGDTSCQPIRNKIITAKFTGFDRDLIPLSTPSRKD